MDRVSFDNVANNYVTSECISQQALNERKKASFVTKLEPQHRPDETMRQNVMSLLDRFGDSDSIKVTMKLHKDILSELNNMQQEISEARERIFSIVNQNSDQVYGVLKPECTVIDRDQYINKIMCYHEVEFKVSSVTRREHEGHFVISVPELGHNHRTALWGDMYALRCLLEGRPANLPDLTYNVGRFQFG